MTTALTAIYCLFLLTLCVNAAPTYKGLWWWTWTGGLVSGSNNLNMAIAFSGWTSPASALSESANIVSGLPGTKYLSLGGGNANGRWTANDLVIAKAACQAGDFTRAGYHGIAWDIEEGDAGLSGPFAQAFSACKTAGLANLVTISHSAPYGVPDAAALMAGFFPDSNIDFLSPQLYTSGSETVNDYALTAGVQWSQYANAKAAIIPSIVTGSLYDECERTFASYGVPIKGYIQWAQTVTLPAGGGSPTPVSIVPKGSSITPAPVAAAPVVSGSGCPNPFQCKSQYGYCGVTAAYCGAGCQSGPCYSTAAPKTQPTAPPTAVPIAQRNPPTATAAVPTTGTCSPACSAGLCCSKWGYCGSGPDYCGNGRAGDREQQPEEGSHVGELSTGAFAAVVVCSVLGAILFVAGVVVVVRRSTFRAERI